MAKSYLRIFILVSSLVAGGCSLPQRSHESGYIDNLPELQAEDFYGEKRSHEMELAREELGWANQRALTESESAALKTRLQLKKLESRLASDQEKRQYYRLKGSFHSDRERIQFLSLPSVTVRERWAQNRGLASADERYPDEVAELIEKNDVMVGMTPKAVQESWGDPDAIEVAGNPIYGNERWRYNRYVSSDEGYQQQTRIIYFESGRVVGWETF